MAELFADDVSTTLASSATSGATSLTIASASGLPTMAAGDIMRARLEAATPTGAFELVKVTARSGTTLTVLRGQEGTSAAAWASGDKVSFVMTGATLDSFVTVDKLESGDHSIGGAWDYTQTPTVNGTNVATTGDVATLQGLAIGLCIEVSGTYPARPSGFGMVQFRGVDDPGPSGLNLMVEGDDWVDLS